MAPSSSSTPGRLTLKTYQGDVFRRHITVTADAVPYDFTGATGRMQVRSSRNATSADLELTDGNGGITFGSGTIDLYVAAGDMEALAGPYVYDLEITPSADEAFTLIEGPFSVEREVSR